jgi:hypothetical protein
MIGLYLPIENSMSELDLCLLLGEHGLLNGLGFKIGEKMVDR